MGKIKKEVINNLANWIDEKIVLGGIWEMADGPAIRMALNAANNNFGAKIPDDLTNDVETLINDIVAENWAAVENNVAIVMAELINTPLIDGTEEEIEAYKLAVSAISNLIQGWLNKS
jgi:hypothetical protein